MRLLRPRHLPITGMGGLLHFRPWHAKCTGDTRKSRTGLLLEEKKPICYMFTVRRGNYPETPEELNLRALGIGHREERSLALDSIANKKAVRTCYFDRLYLA
jgi:hypothetical protein